MQARDTGRVSGSPPPALCGRAGHDGCRRHVDAGRRRHGVQQAWDRHPRPSTSVCHPPTAAVALPGAAPRYLITHRYCRGPMKTDPARAVPISWAGGHQRSPPSDRARRAVV